VTSGHIGASACALEAGTARTAVADVAAHDVAPERIPAFPCWLHFTDLFSKLFFSNFSN
jgi:hypothetical protein